MVSRINEINPLSLIPPSADYTDYHTIGVRFVLRPTCDHAKLQRGMSALTLTTNSYALNSRSRAAARHDLHVLTASQSPLGRSFHDAPHSLVALRDTHQHRCSVAANALREPAWDSSPPCQLPASVLDLHGMGMCSTSMFATELGLPVWEPSDWEFGRHLGSGSFGTVYQAIDVNSGRSWAVKALSKSPELGRRPTRGTGRCV